MTTAPACSTLSIACRYRGVPRSSPLDRLRKKGRKVDDLQLRAGGAHPVVEHHRAEWACHRQGLRASAGGFAYALFVDGLAPPLLHPHARAAGAAAEGALAVARHFHRVPGGGRQLTRRLAHVVVAREVARVVVSDLPVTGERLQLAFAQEGRQELCVVHDLVSASEVGVFVADGVEAVRARGDDLLDLHLVQRADVLLCLLLERVLISHASRRIAGARLAWSEDGEVDAGLLEQPRGGDRGLLRTLVERRRAADPEEDVGRGFAGVEHADAEAVSPMSALRLRLAPRVARPIDVAQHRRRLIGKTRLDHDQVAADVDDRVDMLDAYRAFPHARAARHAVPDDVVSDCVRDEWP